MNFVMQIRVLTVGHHDTPVSGPNLLVWPNNAGYLPTHANSGQATQLLAPCREPLRLIEARGGGGAYNHLQKEYPFDSLTTITTYNMYCNDMSRF